LADEHGSSPKADAQFLYVFQSVEVSSRPMQNQNVNVNAWKAKHSPTHLRLTARPTTTKRCILCVVSFSVACVK